MLQPKNELLEFAEQFYEEEQDCFINIEFRSELERHFAGLWVRKFPQLDLTYEWVLYKPKRGRPMTLDFYHEGAMVGVELNGGIHQRMGHSTGKGIQRDYRKAQICAARQILLFPLSTADVDEPQVLEDIANTIRSRLSLDKENS